ncbi:MULTISPECIES: hypothetical protein [unclassified Paenibacillus]|uniref:hypothetical protein n=1 Tax=unclassified Paenibacillus TaxID=185978 RepID=UPI0036D23B22
MAKREFSDLKSMFTYLDQQAQSVLKQEVAKKTVEKMQQHIQSDVYDVYDPVLYERKGYNGGLIDEDSIEVGLVDDNTLYVENIRFDGDREVAEIVESGQGYTYDFLYNGVPRPFTENTRQELQQTGVLNEVMRNGLSRRGLDVK